MLVHAISPDLMNVNFHYKHITFPLDEFRWFAQGER